MDIANTIVAMVHDRVGGALAAFLSGGKSPFFITPSATLVAQLEDTKVALPSVSAGLVGDIAVSSVSGATGQGGVAGGPRLLNPELLAQVRDAVVGQLPFHPQQGQTNSEGAIEGLVALHRTSRGCEIRKRGVRTGHLRTSADRFPRTIGPLL